MSSDSRSNFGLSARFAILSAFVFLASSGISGCSSTQIADSAASGQSTPGIRLAVRWQLHLGGNSVLDLRPSEFGGVSVSPSGRNLAVVTQSGDIASLDAATSEVLWDVKSGDTLSSMPAIDNSSIYVASHDGFVTAYNLVNGDIRWRTDLGMMLNGSPLLVDNEIYVSGSSEALVVLDRATGTEKWRHSNERFTELDLRGGPTPLVTENFVFVGYSNGTLHKLARATGDSQWVADLAGDAEELRDVDSVPLLIDDTIYASSFSGGVWALDAENGQEKWHLKLTGADRLLPLPGERLVTVSSGSRVVWIDARFGEEIYDIKLIGNGLGGPIPLTDDFMAVYDSNRGLRIVDAERPFIHTEFIPGGGIDAAPVVSGQSMYVMTNHGYLYALDMLRR